MSQLLAKAPPGLLKKLLELEIEAKTQVEIEVKPAFDVSASILDSVKVLLTDNFGSALNVIELERGGVRLVFELKES